MIFNQQEAIPILLQKYQDLLTMITRITVANASAHSLVSSRKSEWSITFYRKFSIGIRFMYCSLESLNDCDNLGFIMQIES